MRKRIVVWVALVLACGGTGEAAQGGDATGGGAAASPAAAEGTVLFVGTSLTAGYGLGEEYAYPALIGAKIDSAGLPYAVVNAGVSGETSAGGLRRIDWMLQRPVDVLVVELGANDGLRGLPVEQLRENLDAILTRARERYPEVALVLLGMQAPPNLGPQYGSAFRNVYRDLAAEHDATLVPFLLEGVAAQRSLNLDDGIHPNAQGQQILARTVWDALRPVLEGRMD